MRNRIRKIRLEMGYSIADFGELLGYKKAAYQRYENGTRPLPKDILKNAQDAQKRDIKFFKELPKRIEETLKGKAVPNEARRNEW